MKITNLERARKSESIVTAELEKMVKQKKLSEKSQQRALTELKALSARIENSIGTNDLVAASVDASYLELLAAEAQVEENPNASAEYDLEEAEKNHALALVDQVRSSGANSAEAIGKALVERVNTLLCNTETADQATAVIRAMSFLCRKIMTNPDPTNSKVPIKVEYAALGDGMDMEVIKGAEAASTALAKQNQATMKSMGRSKDATDEAPRVPTEVLVHLQAKLEARLKQSPTDPELEKLLAKARKMFMAHTMTIEATKSFLSEAAKDCADHPDLAKLCTELTGQLPKDKASLPRLHDNIYGRALDSKMMGDLVKDPPKGVTEAMEQTCKAMAKLLKSLGTKAGGCVGNIQTEGKIRDPRFWMNKTPELKEIWKNMNPNVGLAGILKFLESPKTKGFDCVAVPWLLVRLGNGLDEGEGASDRYKNVPWKEEGDKNYKEVITKQTSRESIANENNKTALNTEGAGLNLAHQPSALPPEQDMTPSVRPTTRNRPTIGEGQNPSKAITQALEHGLPYASGCSGSTNVLLHLMKHLQKQGVPINTKDFLLGSMMFLVYDGGHSIQEVLWTANQLNDKLDLKLDLGGNSNDPNSFVADYDKFIAMFEGATADALKRANENAWTGVTQYFEEYSQFAGTK
jgi:hypothetical protein